MDAEEETVGQDCEERGEAFDGVHERDGNARHGVGIKDVPADLEGG